MDKGKLVRLVLIPVIIGLVVTLIVRQVLQGSQTTSGTNRGSQVEMVSVVTIASKEAIPARTKLTEAQLALKQMPANLMTGHEFSAVKDVAGQMTIVALDPGEIVFKSRVMPEGKGSLAYRLKPGMRAITIRIDELSGVAGHPEPGDLVDLILFLQEKKPDRPFATSRLIYEGVEVLGKGMAPAPDGSAAKGGPPGADNGKLTSITLAVRPEQAVEITLGEQLGMIKTMLRPAAKEGDVGRLMFKEDAYNGSGSSTPNKQ